MYKLLAVDLDGTLLNSYGEVSNKNKEAIKKAISKGIDVVVTSGRPISAAKSYAIDIEANNYMICGNGSVLYDLKNEKILFGDFIDKKKVLRIINICEENSISYSVFTDKTILTKALSYNMRVFNYENINRSDDKKTQIKIVDDVYKYVLENDSINVLKITICDDSKIIFGRIINKLREIKDVEVLDIAHMSSKKIKDGVKDVIIEYYYTEITNKNVNKWNAIKELIKIKNINDSEVVAIGDNINDKEMIEGAGLGIIMKNSAPYMKEFADKIADDNNSDGVAMAIEEYII